MNVKKERYKVLWHIFLIYLTTLLEQGWIWTLWRIYLHLLLLYIYMHHTPFHGAEFAPVQLRRSGNLPRLVVPHFFLNSSLDSLYFSQLRRSFLFHAVLNDVCCENNKCIRCSRMTSALPLKEVICSFECPQTQSFDVALTLKGLYTCRLRPKDVES